MIRKTNEICENVTIRPNQDRHPVVRPDARRAAIGVDICVVGAGIAGIRSAEAARLAQVRAVDGCTPRRAGRQFGDRDVLRVALSNTTPATSSPTDRGRHFARSRRAGALHHCHGGSSNTVVSGRVALSRWIEEQVRQAGITVLLGAVIRGVVRDGRRIRELELATRYGDVRLVATGFVDATGDAALAWTAGFACREAADGPIYGTQMVVIEGIDEEHQPTRPEVAERLKQKARDYGLTRESGFAFVFPGKNIALVNMTHVETPLDPVEATRKSLEGKVQADRAVAFLRAEYPAAFGKARVRTYGGLGIRQTRWIVGRQQLTVADVRAGRAFPDAVARTGWPIELHDTPQGYVWEPFGDDHLHTVPFGSLGSPECGNLVAAGRCIDGDVARSPACA